MKNTIDYLKQIFGEDLETWLDFIQVLVTTKMRMPSILIYGERESGKTTFLKWLLKMIDESTYAYIMPYELTSQYKENPEVFQKRLLVAEEILCDGFFHEVSDDMLEIYADKANFKSSFILTSQSKFTYEWFRRHIKNIVIIKLRKLPVSYDVLHMLESERKEFIGFLKTRELTINHGV